MLNYQQYCKHKSINETLSYRGGDVTRMPIIGKLLCKEFQWGEHKFPPVEYDIVEVKKDEDNGRTYYITSKWYKEGRTPLVIDQDLVDTYTPTASTL